MSRYDIGLTEERGKQLEEIAAKQGVTVDDVVRGLVNDYLLNSNCITRFAAKKGRKGRVV